MTTIRVGDPDPTSLLGGLDSYCWAPHRLPTRSITAYCSWALGHEGDHVSADVGTEGAVVTAVWSGDKPPPGRVWSPNDTRPWVLGPQGGQTAGQWTDAMTQEGRRIGVNRQCSIGWHAECSDPEGESCRCACHGGD